ncbi:MAG: bacteriohopanetetrol glucosamine biosynthesis glycosyltransferase HpnI [Alphaproteobacteria bacterium]|nr:bacteriohopanetetrol glucosamine biosynthesis glycosyltransferase HpnI [Alphaproteobacteria bacterium]
MRDLYILLQVVCLVPVVCGAAYQLLGLFAAYRFFARPSTDDAPDDDSWPPVTILRPVHGLDKNFAANMRSACLQDYPAYQVVFAVQRLDDPALPVLEEIAAEFGPDRVTLVAVDSEPVVNGKMQNLSNALSAARHDILLISDSDVHLRPDYLKAIVAPLRTSEAGFSCSLYRAGSAETWYEKLELLTLNADFTASILFAEITDASDFCLGSSVAFRRKDLEEIGGFEALADYLVEDYEMGRRFRKKGLKMALVPYFVDLVVDLEDPRQWWHHQVYWDQNTWAAQPVGFLFMVLTFAVPFALLFALLRLFDPIGMMVLAAVLAVRLGTAGVFAAHYLRDRATLRSLVYLPLRDLAGLLSWFTAIRKRTFIWRGHEFGLTREGRIVPRKVSP